MRCVSLCALFAGAAAHAGLIIPTTRNSIDRLAKGFSVDGLGLRTPCTCSDRGTGNSQGCRGDGCGPGLGAKCASGTDLNVRAEGGAGQPCLWWSQVKWPLTVCMSLPYYWSKVTSGHASGLTGM